MQDLICKASGRAQLTDSQIVQRNSQPENVYFTNNSELSSIASAALFPSRNTTFNKYRRPHQVKTPLAASRITITIGNNARPVNSSAVIFSPQSITQINQSNHFSMSNLTDSTPCSSS